ncbi:MAG: HlyD family efflux transporter periplasmic adaptor subunit [Cocleimonas sp.]
MKKIFKNFIFLPLIIVGAIALVMMQLKSKQAIEHEDIALPVKTIEYITAKNIPFRARAIAYGNVEPETVLNAKSEVNGKISYIHPKLKQGGILPKGTTVLKIDATTFEISLDSSQAGLASSQSSLQQLKTEEDSAQRSLLIAKKNLNIGTAELNRVKQLVSKGTLARNQLNLEEQKVLQLRSNVQDLQGKLNTYASKKSSTRAQIKQSKSQVDQSKDTLVRTAVILPFDARIGSVSVEAGEFVSAGSLLFEALGIQAVEINAQLPVKQVRPLAKAMSNKLTSESLQNTSNLQKVIEEWDLDIKVRIVGGEHSSFWNAELLRLSESVDPTRDTLGMVVSVKNPYEGVIPGIRPPLIKGMYTSVEFLSQPTNMLVIPRKALHEGRVYTVSKDNTLDIKPVEILYAQGELLVIKTGISDGEKIVISDLVPVIQGLKLNPIESENSQEEIALLALGSEASDEKSSQ